MALSNLDILRTANILIRNHGEDAPIHAAMRADELLDKGDLDGAAARRQCLGSRLSEPAVAKKSWQ